MYCVDLGESFHMSTSLSLQNLASIQPRMSLVKFARSPRTDPPGIASFDQVSDSVLGEDPESRIERARMASVRLDLIYSNRFTCFKSLSN